MITERNKLRKFSPLRLSFLFILMMLIDLPDGMSQQDTTSRDSLMQEAPNVYLDCYFCDVDHIKREIHYVNYVRDRKDADVHIIGARERAGNGGRRYTFFLLGQNGYKKLKDTLQFNVGPDVSDEETRARILHAFRSGLTAYLIKTPLWQNLNITYAKPAEEEAEVRDKWNYWVFEVSADGRLDLEESQQGYDLSGEIQANKVTEDVKVELGLDMDYDQNIYEVNSHSITSIHRSYDFDWLYVRSLSEHWSAGASGSAYSSKYRNMAISYRAAPAVEFNVFPYSESTTRQLTILYRPRWEYNFYNDTTLFGKIRENLFRESLAIDYEVKKKWGSIDFSLDLSHYFHDFSKNRVSFRSSVSLNLVKGLNVYFYGRASLIQDQLSLPKGEATTEEILTRQQELATDYQYYTSIGLSYTFGSMYNNVVNPRF